MNEHERDLRSMLRAAAPHAYDLAGDALITKALSRARAEALKEVCAGLARQADFAQRSGEVAEVGDVLNSTHDWVHGLIGATSQACIPVERVRESLGWAAKYLEKQGYGWGIIRDISKRLGVSLDAAQVHDEPSFDPAPHLCKGCDKPADGSEGHRFSCTVHGKQQVVAAAEEVPAHEMPDAEVPR